MSAHQEGFDPFAQYPVWPGSKGSAETSAEAATAIAPEVATIRARALVLIRGAGRHGLTSEELANKMGLPRVSVQPRTSELRNLGKLADSGQRRENASSGKRAVVWVLPDFAPAGDDS
jgi:hypothetical protein